MDRKAHTKYCTTIREQFIQSSPTEQPKNYLWENAQQNFTILHGYGAQPKHVIVTWVCLNSRVVVQTTTVAKGLAKSSLCIKEIYDAENKRQKAKTTPRKPSLS